MYISVLILLWIVSNGAGNSCETCKYNFHCSNITQEDFFRYSFKNEDDLKENVTTVEIINSYFTLIDFLPLPLPFTRQGINIKCLKLIDSRIEFVSDNAFIAWESLESLDLSRNRISNISFLKHLPHTVSKVDISYNEFTVLDLNFVKFKEIFFSHNKIYSLKRISGDRHDFDMIDLSYNNLVNFNELETNTFSTSLDISYNQLEKLVLDSSYKIKDTVNIMGNNISYFGPDNNSGFWCKNLLATNLSSMPYAHIEASLIISGSNIGVLNEEFLDLTKLLNNYQFCDRGVINLSNSSISAISESFFTRYCVSEINLSYNNISSLEKPIFKEMDVRLINLSYSRIRTISKRTFEGAVGCVEIILRGNFLKDVDNICRGSTIRTIDLSFNKIEKISSDTLFGCELISVDLSFNLIHDIEPGAFQTVYGLQVLDLSNNNITFGNTTISNLSHIKSINVSSNNVKVLETNAFTNLSISYLKIHNNPVKVVKFKAFNNLYNLRILNLSKIGIDVLEGHAFFKLPSINTIDLTDNRLSTIESYTFSNMPLKEILLKGNQILTLKTHAFYNLPHVLNLDLSRQKITEIKYFSFSNFFVEKLDLRYNNITDVRGYMFDNVTIERLYLNENKITKLYPIENRVKIREMSLEFRGKLQKGAISNMYLEKLVLTNSHIDLIENGCFDGAYNLNELTFKNSSILSYQPEFLRNLFNLKHFEFHSFISKGQKLKSYMFRDNGKLERLTLDHLNFTAIEKFTFIGLKSLKSLSLVGNHITNSYFSLNSIDGLEQLLFLNLSANAFKSINLAIIKFLPKLNILDLSHNRIKYILRNYYNGKFYNNLTILYLNDNFITNIDHDAFAYLENLKYLNLENNNIKLFSDIFKHQERLESLYLGHNSLEDIPQTTFHHLKLLEKLYLNDNNLKSFRSGIFNGPQNLKVLDVSQNNILITFPLSSSALRSLSRLVHLNLDYCNLEYDFEYRNIPIYFPYLETIKVNHNSFNCPMLLDMLQFFDKIKIDYTPQTPKYEFSNYFGISCSDPGSDPGSEPIEL